MQEAADKLRDTLQYIAVQLIDHPDQAELRVAVEDENHYRFRLIVAAEDVAILIGKNGFTASAIRSLLKASAEKHGIQASLLIHSHEDERRRVAALEAAEIIEE